MLLWTWGHSLSVSFQCMCLKDNKTTVRKSYLYLWKPRIRWFSLFKRPTILPRNHMYFDENKSTKTATQHTNLAPFPAYTLFVIICICITLSSKPRSIIFSSIGEKGNSFTPLIKRSSREFKWPHIIYIPGGDLTKIYHHASSTTIRFAPPPHSTALTEYFGISFYLQISPLSTCKATKRVQLRLRNSFTLADFWKYPLFVDSLCRHSW